MIITYDEKLGKKQKGKWLAEGREEGQIIANINKLNDAIGFHEKALVRLKKLLDKKEINEKIFKTMSSPVQSHISKCKKEIRLLKNKQKRLPKE